MMNCIFLICHISSIAFKDIFFVFVSCRVAAMLPEPKTQQENVNKFAAASSIHSLLGMSFFYFQFQPGFFIHLEVEWKHSCKYTQNHPGGAIAKNF
jgi:hypothetical protein